jgi:hypothetical protein
MVLRRIAGDFFLLPGDTPDTDELHD